MRKNKLLEVETPQAGVRIEQDGVELHLKFDSDIEAIQSAINTEHPQNLVMENLRYLMGILMFIPAPEKILLLGVGGGSLIHFLQHYLPQSHITGVEYNSQLLDIAHTHLKLPPASDRLSYILDDAKNVIDQCSVTYDLIVVDIFEGGLTPPWLLEQPFNAQLKTCLSQQGAVAYNLLVNNEKTFSRFYNLLRKIYHQQTLCMETEDYENLLIYGLNFSTEEKTMTQHLDHCMLLAEDFDLPFSQILSVIYDINPVGSGII